MFAFALGRHQRQADRLVVVDVDAIPDLERVEQIRTSAGTATVRGSPSAFSTVTVRTARSYCAGVTTTVSRNRRAVAGPMADRARDGCSKLRRQNPPSRAIIAPDSPRLTVISLLSDKVMPLALDTGRTC